MKFEIDDMNKLEGKNVEYINPKTPSSVLIATPMYGGNAPGQYTISIINTINHLSNNSCETYLANLTNESLITRARNELVRMFLNDSKCTHIMFIDARYAVPGRSRV